ncbi:hypothetical protein D3C72_1918530 [compost metagenome]
MTAALIRSGRWVSMAPMNRPPCEPPMIPRCGWLVMPRVIRSWATAWKSSWARWRFSCWAAWCHLGPNSPPPRVLAMT